MGGEHNMALIIMMIIAIILLFVAMVLSAMASSAAKKESSKGTAHKYSMYAAVVCGISVLLIGIALVIYFNRETISSHIPKMTYDHMYHRSVPEATEMASMRMPQKCIRHFEVECDANTGEPLQSARMQPVVTSVYDSPRSVASDATFHSSRRTPETSF